MAINQPPISKDVVRATWDLEVTQTVNALEERVRALLEAIKDANDLSTLQDSINEL